MNDILAWGQTDVGRVREKNEDSFGIFSFADMTVAVVADGMGGHLGGKAASEAAVKAFQKLFERNRGRLPVPEIIEDALVLANRNIGEKSITDFENQKIGTTCTVAVVAPVPLEERADLAGAQFQAYLAHLGDSKLFFIQNGSINQLSTDHTMLQKMVEAGALNPEEAEKFPHKNIIYRSLDGSENLSIDPARRIPFRPGEALLLCSDGLSNYVSPSEILRVFRGKKTAKDAVGYLIKLATVRGGDDNITVVILECGPHRRDRSIKIEKVKGTRLGSVSRAQAMRKRGIIALLGALAVVIGLLAYQIAKKDVTISATKSTKPHSDLIGPAGLKDDSDADSYDILIEKAKQAIDSRNYEQAQDLIDRAKHIDHTAELEALEQKLAEKRKELIPNISPKEKTEKDTDILLNRL